MGPVGYVTSTPSKVTCLPLLSIVSCCRYAANRFRYCSYGSTATVWAPKKSLYQTLSRPMSTGTLRSNGTVRKCSSIRWQPPSMARHPSGRVATIVESPIAESMEYRPPTQSQKPNMLAVSMPNFVTSPAFVDTATKCFATDFSLPLNPLSNQFRALIALVMVSRVVKVLDETMNSV